MTINWKTLSVVVTSKSNPKILGYEFRRKYYGLNVENGGWITKNGEFIPRGVKHGKEKK